MPGVPMRIVVLDGYTANPGDLSWRGLERFGDVAVYDRTAPSQVRARSEGAACLLTNKTVLDSEIFQDLPACRYIGVLATGYNVVDLAAAARQGITVTNVPAYSTDSVAQMVFAHLLNLAQHVGDHSGGVHEGKWAASKDFCYWEFPLVELAGKTIGVVGYGKTGRAVSQLAHAFGMRILVSTRTASSPQPSGIRFVSLDELFKKSDVVTLHCSLTDATHHLVNAERLGVMKPGAFLINTSRGPVVDPQALADALNDGTIAGAGIDVMASEPPDPADPLLSAKNCYITPHIAWATRESRRRLIETAVDNVRAFVEGTPQHVVAPQ